MRIIEALKRGFSTSENVNHSVGYFGGTKTGEGMYEIK